MIGKEGGTIMELTERRKALEAKAMGPTSDGLEPIACWEYVGDGAFSVSFGGIGWNTRWSPEDALSPASGLTRKWRKLNAAHAADLPVVTIHKSGTVATSRGAPQTTFYEVEVDGKPAGRHATRETAEDVAWATLDDLAAGRGTAPRP